MLYGFSDGEAPLESPLLACDADPPLRTCAKPILPALSAVPADFPPVSSDDLSAVSADILPVQSDVLLAVPADNTPVSSDVLPVPLSAVPAGITPEPLSAAPAGILPETLSAAPVDTLPAPSSTNLPETLPSVSNSLCELSPVITVNTGNALLLPDPGSVLRSEPGLKQQQQDLGPAHQQLVPRLALQSPVPGPARQLLDPETAL